MGHVQSGKTANYLGLVAKAMDAGYKLVVIMAGFNNLLRSDPNASRRRHCGAGPRNGAGSIGKVGVGLLMSHKAVVTMTSASDAGDFKKAVANGFGSPFSRINVPTVFVIQKHLSVLRKTCTSG